MSERGDSAPARNNFRRCGQLEVMKYDSYDLFSQLPDDSRPEKPAEPQVLSVGATDGPDQGPVWKSLSAASG